MCLPCVCMCSEQVLSLYFALSSEVSVSPTPTFKGCLCKCKTLTTQSKNNKLVSSNGGGGQSQKNCHSLRFNVYADSAEVGFFSSA